MNSIKLIDILQRVAWFVEAAEKTEERDKRFWLESALIQARKVVAAIEDAKEHKS